MSVITSAPSAAPATHVDGPLRRVAHWSIRHRWLAILIWLVVVGGAVVAGSVTGMRTLSSAQQGSGESGRADRVAAAAGFPAHITERVLIQAPPGRAGAIAAQVRSRMSGMPEVASVGAPVVSRDGGSTVVPVTVAVGNATGDAALELAKRRVTAVQAATAAVARANPDATVGQVGDASIQRALDNTFSGDFQRSELLSIPVTLGILLVAFGALFAAGVPVLLALSAVATAMGMAAVASQGMPLGESAGSVTMLIGMAVGVDYSLFYVRRAREERAAGAPARYALSAQRVEDDSLSAIEFYTPGILGWAISVGAVFAAALTLVNWREKGILRQLRLAPVTVGEIGLARVLVSVGVAIVQLVVFFAVGIGIYGLRLSGAWWMALPLVVAGTLAFLAVGLLVGGLVKTVDAASAVANLVVLPMAFLSGAFFPVDAAPGWLQLVAKLMPLRYLLEGLKDVTVRGLGASAALPELGILLAFAAVVGAIGTRVFRWDSG